MNLECSELQVLGEEVPKFRGLSTAGYQMWSKILIYNNTDTRMYIYSHSRSYCIEFSKAVYSVAQVNFTIYLWTSSGIYTYNHEEEEKGLQFVVKWPYKPRNKYHCLGYYDGKLFFLTSDHEFMVYELDTNATYQYNEDKSFRLYNFDDGIIVFQRGHALKFEGVHHAQ